MLGPGARKRDARTPVHSWFRTSATPPCPHLLPRLDWAGVVACFFAFKLRNRSHPTFCGARAVGPGGPEPRLGAEKRLLPKARQPIDGGLGRCPQIEVRFVGSERIPPLEWRALKALPLEGPSTQPVQGDRFLRARAVPCRVRPPALKGPGYAYKAGCNPHLRRSRGGWHDP